VLIEDLNEIWIYLAASPLFGLTVTLVIYHLAHRFYLAVNSAAIANPVAIAVALLIGLLLLIDMPYQDYFFGAQFIHFLLGPATVALAIPLYLQLDRIKSLFVPLMVGILVGVIVGTGSSIGIAKLTGADTAIWLSLAPKSVTAPVAMSISEAIGGISTLTAVLVVTTGIIGAVTGNTLLKYLRIEDNAVKGVAMGASAHGIGTARALQSNLTMGAFSGLSMALSALVSSLLIPVMIGLFKG
jgi:predicted murein hydrolase (TIGR00659 family)